MFDKWTDYKGASPYYMVLMPTITSCLCSTTLACSLHMGQEVHFILIRKMNRTMWEFFFSAVIFKTSSDAFLMRGNSIYGINISYCCDIRFVQFLCPYIVFRHTVRFQKFVSPFWSPCRAPSLRESRAEWGACITL